MMTFEEFETDRRHAGANDVVTRTWQANQIVEPHAHAFDVEALLVEGELWLTCDGETRHLRPGDRYSVPRNVPHHERYGASGATAWVARTHT